MKKKIITALAALMVMSMGTTVLAASPSTSEAAAEVYKEAVKDVSAEAADGTKVEVTISVADTAVIEKAETDVVEAAEEAVLAETDAEEATATVKAIFDVELDGVKATKKNPVTLNFEIQLDSDKEILVYHWDGKKWENESVKNVKYSDGVLSADFTDLSPIAIVEVEIPETTSADESEESEDETSPKTFDPTIGIMALTALCGAGTIVCAKKKNK